MRRYVTKKTVDRRRTLAGRPTRTAAKAMNDDRRASVFAAAVGLAPEDPFNPLPPKGAQRDALADRLRELKEQRGATHLQAAVNLNLEVGQIAQMCREYGIKSVPRDGATRTKGYAPLPGGDAP